MGSCIGCSPTFCRTSDFHFSLIKKIDMFNFNRMNNEENHIVGFKCHDYVGRMLS